MLDSKMHMHIGNIVIWDVLRLSNLMLALRLYYHVRSYKVVDHPQAASMKGGGWIVYKKRSFASQRASFLGQHQTPRALSTGVQYLPGWPGKGPRGTSLGDQEKKGALALLPLFLGLVFCSLDRYPCCRDTLCLRAFEWLNSFFFNFILFAC